MEKCLKFKVPKVLRVILFILTPGIPGTLGTISTNKKGKLLISHRYNCLPLLSSDPGGVQQELVV
jgi:hypothetical protein